MAPKTCAHGQLLVRAPRPGRAPRRAASTKSSAMPTPRGFFGLRLQRLQDEERHQHGARPVGHLGEVEREPARQEHDLDRHDRHAAPRHLAVEREQEAGEDVAARRAAARQDRLAGAAHVRRVDRLADHLQREIGLDAGAHVEGAVVEQRPAAVRALDAAEIGGDLAPRAPGRALAAEMAEEHVFGRDGGVGLELEAPMAVVARQRREARRVAGVDPRIELREARLLAKPALLGDGHSESLEHFPAERIPVRRLTGARASGRCSRS